MGPYICDFWNILCLLLCCRSEYLAFKVNRACFTWGSRLSLLTCTHSQHLLHFLPFQFSLLTYIIHRLSCNSRRIWQHHELLDDVQTIIMHVIICFMCNALHLFFPSTEYKCPYNGDIRCNGRCYRSDTFCHKFQYCYSSGITNCSKFIAMNQGVKNNAERSILFQYCDITYRETACAHMPWPGHILTCDHQYQLKFFSFCIIFSIFK